MINYIANISRCILDICTIILVIIKFIVALWGWHTHVEQSWQNNLSSSLEISQNNSVDAGTRPIDFFNLLVDESFFGLIVRETNRQAEEIFLSSVTAPSSRISRWRDITVEDLRIFFGVFLHMGTISLNRLQDYWKTSNLFSIPFFTSSMSRDRFLLILRWALGILWCEASLRAVDMYNKRQLSFCFINHKTNHFFLFLHKI